MRGAAAVRAKADEAAVPERRCIVTREVLPTDRLIRFVVGPDGEIVPDLAERLPGRGLWLTADGAIVDTACARNLFAKAARRAVTVPPGLCETVEALLVQRCLELTGLARRSGLLAAGHRAAEEAVRTGRCRLLLVAADSTGRDAADLLRRASGVTVSRLLTSDELGVATGRGRLVFAALSEGGLTARLERELTRLAGFRTAPAKQGTAAQRDATETFETKTETQR